MSHYFLADWTEQRTLLAVQRVTGLFFPAQQWVLLSMKVIVSLSKLSWLRGLRLKAAVRHAVSLLQAPDEYCSHLTEPAENKLTGAVSLRNKPSKISVQQNNDSESELCICLLVLLCEGVTAPSHNQNTETEDGSAKKEDKKRCLLHFSNT